MKTTADFIEDLRAAGIRLSVRDGRLHAGPAGLITPDFREAIAAHRQALMEAVLERDRAPELQEAQVTIDHLHERRAWALERLQESQETIAGLRREIAYLKYDASVSQDLADLYKNQYRRLLARQSGIPEPVFKALRSCCHPDRATNQEAARISMVWLNAQARVSP